MTLVCKPPCGPAVTTVLVVQPAPCVKTGPC